MALSLAEDDRDDGEEDVEQSGKITTEKAEETESRGYRRLESSFTIVLPATISVVCDHERRAER